MVAALTFPVALSDFFDDLDIVNIEFYDSQPMEYSRTAGGSVLKSSLGDSLWRGAISLAPATHDDAMAVEAFLSVMQRPGSSFFAYDARRAGPRQDPNGTTLGASTVTLLAADADNRRLSLQGLPSSYVISRGDMLSFQHSSPTQYHLHRVVQGATSDGSGDTELMEVTPFIEPGAANGDSVQLLKPYMLAKLLPNPTYGSGQAGYSNGGSFEFIQVFG